MFDAFSSPKVILSIFISHVLKFRLNVGVVLKTFIWRRENEAFFYRNNMCFGWCDHRSVIE
jgi:hypothetical protein